MTQRLQQLDDGALGGGTRKFFARARICVSRSAKGLKGPSMRTVAHTLDLQQCTCGCGAHIKGMPCVHVSVSLHSAARRANIDAELAMTRASRGEDGVSSVPRHACKH